jgi:hypothetical protein
MSQPASGDPQCTINCNVGDCNKGSSLVERLGMLLQLGSIARIRLFEDNGSGCQCSHHLSYEIGACHATTGMLTPTHKSMVNVRGQRLVSLLHCSCQGVKEWQVVLFEVLMTYGRCDSSLRLHQPTCILHWSTFLASGCVTDQVIYCIRPAMIHKACQVLGELEKVLYDLIPRPIQTDAAYEDE